MSLPGSFDLTPEDAKLLLAANVHLGSKNVQVCIDEMRQWQGPVDRTGVKESKIGRKSTRDVRAVDA
ncbi:unnamed protein product [Debaryomyces fabryi]|nr:unnamed protein product [Debaryomyces fabryi]